MKIAVLNRQGTGSGGATRAARRLIDGLRARGHTVVMVSLAPGHDPAGIGVEALHPGDGADRRVVRANEHLHTGYIHPRRSSVSNTLFSSEVAGYDLAGTGLFDDVDVINIHWVPGFLVPHNLGEIIAMGKPVVFTLHDMAAFTGGCHYSAGCGGYRETCAPCPQIDPDVLRIAAWTLAEKRGVLRVPNVAAVSPSRWLAECAEASRVFSPGVVRVIPNGLETDLFRPTPKAVAKRGLGIAPEVRTLLFGAENGQERRKGFDLLLDAVRRMRADPGIAALLQAGQLRILAFGQASAQLQEIGLPVQDLGMVRHDAHLALIYSAADLVALPSREDNLPNILLEAMACGTPAVAFAVGGIADVIENGRNGLSVPPLDTGGMASAIANLLEDSATAAALGEAARRSVTERYTLDAQAGQYEALFGCCLAALAAPACPGVFRPSAGVLAVPVTLHPDAAAGPIGLFIEQQARIDVLSEALSGKTYELDRAGEVLREAVSEARASSSWRYTRWLRRGWEPELVAEASCEAMAVTLLTVMRSKSWELTGLLRTAVRLLRSGLRWLRAKLTAASLGSERSLGGSASTTGDFAIRLDFSQNEPVAVGAGEPGELNPICLHLFHVDLWDEFRSALLRIVGPETPLYVSLPAWNAEFGEYLVREFGPQACRCFIVENRGLDVLPFLQQFRFLQENGLRPRTLTKLHTKRSAHVPETTARRWRLDLSERLLAEHRGVVDAFRKNPRLGMVCCEQWWLAEGMQDANWQAESRVIAEACDLFGVPAASHYLSGSMYTVSYDYLEQLLAPLDLDTYFASFPEGYHPCDTPAHAFERVVCYGLRKYDRWVGLL
ncbi:glycosyltransferase [Methylotetracoccus oryzae]|uniref:glycosyltransferase n=1 Tax=Methylotetracoccus oryzae TaxID=1919059 RepID=UPI00111A8401|nr:glycosyltransferase [Methylotetracoccus oryzae]